MLLVIFYDRPQVQVMQRGQDFPGELMHPGFLPVLFRSRGVKPRFKPAETHDVNQFMGEDIAQERKKFQVPAGFQGL